MPVTRKRPTVPHLRGLPATRHGAVALALICAVVAAGILVVAIGQYKTSVQTTTKQDSVLVATGLIQKGTSGDVIATQSLVRSTPILEKSLAVGAITNTSALIGRVAAQDILPGQQLTFTDFTTSQTLGVQTQLAPNQRAVAVTLDAEHGLSGVIEAGDRVDVYGSYQVAPVNGEGYHMVKLLDPDVLVLKSSTSAAAGGGLGGGSSSSSGGGPVLLAVSSNDVGPVTFTSDTSGLWLVLRPANATTPEPYITTMDTIVNNVYAKQKGLAPGQVIHRGNLTVVGASGAS